MVNRRWLKQGLALLPAVGRHEGVTILTYHRVGGGSPDELDLPTTTFVEQVRLLAAHDVLRLDEAIDRLERGDRRPGVVLTFDDGFRDLYDNGWPVLRDAGLPFIVYAASAYLGGRMQWEGSTARGARPPGLTWGQLGEMVDSGLCEVGNHTHRHVRPDRLTPAELDDCTAAVQRELGVTPRHFAYPWGLRVPDIEPDLRRRFRSAVTGVVGRNLPGAHLLALRRVPVRGSDPLPFFRRKLGRGLAPELAYDRAVRVAKAVGVGG